MNMPRRREEVRYIHVDSKQFSNTQKSKYTINFNVSTSQRKNLDINGNHDGTYTVSTPDTGTFIPIQDYNNITKIELKVFKISNSNLDPSSESTQSTYSDQDYVILKIKNIDGHFDSNTPTQDASSIIYFDNKKPTFFEDQTEFQFNPPLSKLNKLDVELIGSDNNEFNYNHSFVLKITYIEGNLY